VKGLCIVVLCICLLALCACGQVVPEEASTTAEVLTTALFGVETTTNAPPLSPAEIEELRSGPYADTIERTLKAYRDDHYQLNQQYYTLYDIDGDGIKELLWAEEWWECIRLTGVCTIQDGTAVWQDELRTGGEGNSICPSSLFKNGTVRVDGREDDELRFYYYRFENGSLRRQTMLVDGSHYFDTEYFRSDDPMSRTRITKAEFDRLQKEFEGDGQTVELDWKPLAEYGR